MSKKLRRRKVEKHLRRKWTREAQFLKWHALKTWTRTQVQTNIYDFIQFGQVGFGYFSVRSNILSCLPVPDS